MRRRTAWELPSTAPLAGGFLTDNAVEGGEVTPPCTRGRAARKPATWGFSRARALRFLSRDLNPDTQEDDH